MLKVHFAGVQRARLPKKCTSVQTLLGLTAGVLNFSWRLYGFVFVRKPCW